MTPEDERQEDLEILASFMRHPAGRRWLYKSLAKCHIFTTSFMADALHTAFAEGERMVGLYLTTELLQANPDLYFVMLREQQSVRYSSTDRDSGAEYGDNPDYPR